jgi:hypothetical protein
MFFDSPQTSEPLFRPAGAVTVKSLSDFQGPSFDKTDGATEFLHLDQFGGCKGPDKCGMVSGSASSRAKRGRKFLRRAFQATICS